MHKICTNDDFKAGFMQFTHCVKEDDGDDAEVAFCSEEYAKLLAAMERGTPKRDICW